MTIPGVGAVTALAFKSTIDIPARFKKLFVNHNQVDMLLIQWIMKEI